jgi:hypothetical protein
MGSVTLLRSRGRRTGQWRTVPVVILRAGERAPGSIARAVARPLARAAAQGGAAGFLDPGRLRRQPLRSGERSLFWQDLRQHPERNAPNAQLLTPLAKYTELITFGVGQHNPRLSTLANINMPCAMSHQPSHLGVLVIRPEVEMQSALSFLGLVKPDKVQPRQAIRLRADLVLVVGGVDHHPTKSLSPPLSQGHRIYRVHNYLFPFQHHQPTLVCLADQEQSVPRDHRRGATLADAAAPVPTVALRIPPRNPSRFRTSRPGAAREPLGAESRHGAGRRYLADGRDLLYHDPSACAQPGQPT